MSCTPLRSGVAIGSIGALSLVMTGVGVATAASGGSLILGHSNAANRTTTLVDHGGTPLSLVGAAGRAPLKVSNSRQVAKLNASLLDGRSAASFGTTGSGALLPDTSDIPLSTDEEASTELVSTAVLAPGTYFISATALPHDNKPSTSEGVRCYIGISANRETSPTIGASGSDSYGDQAAAVSAVVTLKAATTLSEYCYSIVDSASVSDAAIWAVRIDHFAPGKVDVP